MPIITLLSASPAARLSLKSGKKDIKRQTSTSLVMDVMCDTQPRTQHYFPLNMSTIQLNQFRTLIQTLISITLLYNFNYIEVVHLIFPKLSFEKPLTLMIQVMQVVIKRAGRSFSRQQGAGDSQAISRSFKSQNVQSSSSSSSSNLCKLYIFHVTKLQIVE